MNDTCPFANAFKHVQRGQRKVILRPGLDFFWCHVARGLHLLWCVLLLFVRGFDC